MWFIYQNPQVRLLPMGGRLPGEPPIFLVNAIELNGKWMYFAGDCGCWGARAYARLSRGCARKKWLVEVLHPAIQNAYQHAKK